MISAKHLKKTGGPKTLARYLKRRQPKEQDDGGHGAHHGANVSVRTTIHKGHEIEVRTTYEIMVDGKPLEGHMGVGDDGRVHYHPIPNYSSGSMLDLIRSVIDAFPEDYPSVKKHKKVKSKKRTTKNGKHKTHKGGH